VPQNVEIVSGTAVNFGSSAFARTARGNVTIGGTLTLSTALGGDLRLGGNWINNGAFNPNSRAVFFNGSTAQSIDGGADTTFAFLSIDNTAGVSLARAARADNQLTLTNGRLTLGGFDFTLGPSASASGSFDASRMVAADGSGSLCKRYGGIGSFLFPVGDLTATPEYSPATLNFTSGSFSSAQACVKVTNAKHPNMPGSDYLTRYWTVTQSGMTGFNCNVTFDYVDADIIGSEANLSGAKWDAVWTVLNPVDQTNNRFGASVSGFSDFSAGKAAPLAVTLATFGATAQANHILLTWETASELDNRGFNLYRGMSPDGWDRRLNEYLIPSQSQGNPGGFFYTWEDHADLDPGQTYWYWLEAVDLSGATTLHGPVSATVQTPTAVTLASVSASPAAAPAGAALPWLLAVAGAGAALALGRRRR
jgi:hypothetical protein